MPAAEGGAWGIALLAAYAVKRNEGETLENYLSTRVFAGKTGETMSPDAEDCAGFAAYIERYRAALPVERAAVDTLK